MAPTAKSPGWEVRCVGVFYHPRLPAAQELAHEFRATLLSGGIDTWVYSAWDTTVRDEDVRDRDLLISIGGDGTILRVAHLALDSRIPVLGVNMGRLGFMNELSAQEAREKLLCLPSQGGWFEERATLQVNVDPSQVQGAEGQSSTGPLYALNDVVVTRGRVARVIRVEARIDGDLFTTYKGDGVIVATATGSTGYSMAAGGPILHPQSTDFILTPVNPQLAIRNPLVLPSTTTVELKVSSDHEVILSVDGQVARMLQDREGISVTIGPRKALFLRFRPQGRFYSTVTERLTRME